MNSRELRSTDSELWQINLNSMRIQEKSKITHLNSNTFPSIFLLAKRKIFRGYCFQNLNCLKKI